MSFRGVLLHSIVLLVFFLLKGNVNAENLSKQDKAVYKEALRSFDNGRYDLALESFSMLCENYPNDFEFNYYTGICFINSANRKKEAVGYLEKALELNAEYVPEVVHKDLGDLYHALYNFEKSISHYKKFLELTNGNDEYAAHAIRMIAVCKNAKGLISSLSVVEVEKLNDGYNSLQSGCTTLVSPDGKLLFYSETNVRYSEVSSGFYDVDSESKIYVASLSNKSWGKPEKINIVCEDRISDIAIAGISPDGKYIYINAKNKKSRDIYKGRYIKGKPLEVEPLPYPLNTKAWEGSVSVSSDGRSIYFSSNRRGGYGGIDIYKSQLLDGGNWSEPENMGSDINTPYNEDYPFIDDSINRLYFSSNGLNTMGGYDIFSVTINSNVAQVPKNMGYPINSTGDDMNFVLSTNGNIAYFSSSSYYQRGELNVYRISNEDSFFLTLSEK